jgi:hypothetical protein
VSFSITPIATFVYGWAAGLPAGHIDIDHLLSCASGVDDALRTSLAAFEEYVKETICGRLALAGISVSMLRSRRAAGEPQSGRPTSCLKLALHRLLPTGSAEWAMFRGR